MSTTFGTLKTRVSTVLQDPDQKTFTEALVEELIQSALVEVGELAPEQFEEDITLVAGQRVYVVRSDDFDGEAVPEIELSRVELWDPTQTPDAFIAQVPEAALQPSTADSGWSMWGGSLQLPSRTIKSLEGYEGTYVLRITGYSPYVSPSADGDVIAVSKTVEQAMVAYVHLEALKMLLASRNLFTQWQTRSGNSDMSPAGLMNEKNIATEEWRHRARQLTRLRARV